MRIRDWLPGFFSAVRVCLRVLVLAAAVAYLVFTRVSYRVPISPRLAPFQMFGAWVVFLVVLAEMAVESRVFSAGNEEKTRFLRRAWSRLRRRWGLAVYGALMLAVVVPAGMASWSAGVSIPNCDQHDAIDCLKVDNWAESHGEYLRQYPYDARGNSDPGAAWVPISRAQYIAEFGTYLRYVTLFPVVCLGLALVVSVLAEVNVPDSRDGRRFVAPESLGVR